MHFCISRFEHLCKLTVIETLNEGSSIARAAGINEGVNGAKQLHLQLWKKSHTCVSVHLKSVQISMELQTCRNTFFIPPVEFTMKLKLF